MIHAAFVAFAVDELLPNFMIHPRLRTVMLARERVARRASRINLIVGRHIPDTRLQTFSRDQDLIGWLRNKWFKGVCLACGVTQWKLVKYPFTHFRRHHGPLLSIEGDEKIINPAVSIIPLSNFCLVAGLLYFLI
jgi:hypothetical protein